MLIGLGFAPLEAAGLALIGNTAPVAFGALGTPIIALGRRHRTAPREAFARWWVASCRYFPSSCRSGWSRSWRAARHARRVARVSGDRCELRAGPVRVLNLHGPWLVDMVGAIVSMVALVSFSAILASAEHLAIRPRGQRVEPQIRRPRAASRLRAWMPWALLSVFVFVWGVPAGQEFAQRDLRSQDPHLPCFTTR